MAEPSRGRISLSSRDEAIRFVEAFVGAIVALEGVLNEETAHLAAGRIRQGLAQEARKTELAGSYLQGLEVIRANGVALARFAPDAVLRLKEAQTALRGAIGRNQAVLATARAVSEGLIRAVADEVGRQSRPAGYGAGPPPGAGPARPLVFSARM